MFKEAGAGIRIYLDDHARLLRVMEEVYIIPGFRPQWREVATFSTPKAWDESSYAKRVTNETMIDDIDWFWMDLEPENTNQPGPEEPPHKAAFSYAQLLTKVYFYAIVFAFG